MLAKLSFKHRKVSSADKIALRAIRAFKRERLKHSRIRFKRPLAPTHKVTLPKQENAPKRSRSVLNEANHDPSKQLPVDALVNRIVALAQLLSEKRFYDYQIEFGSRIVESVLLHDGEVLTALMARQMGKSETLGSISAALAVILPKLAQQFPDDWKLNCTDDQGTYRGFLTGIKIGIYAPKLEQASMMFERVKKALSTDSAVKILSELGIIFDVRNGNNLKLSNGSSILCESASEQSKIEGATHNVLICEECQDISDTKIQKSLHPMVAATGGTIVKIGTATMKKCDFYTSIKVNERMQATYGLRNHFFYPYTVGIRSNSFYQNHIEKERIRLGEHSDAFQTSYCCQWIFERGMFVTHNALFNSKVSLIEGDWSECYDFEFKRMPRHLRNHHIVAGIDWGSSYDSTVLTLVAVDWNSPQDTGVSFIDGAERPYAYYHKHLFYWKEWIGDNYEKQYWEVINVLSQIPNLRKIVTDSNTCGKPIYDRLNAAFSGTNVFVEEFNFQPKTKSDGYKMFANDLNGKRFTFPASDATRKTSEYGRFVNQMLDMRKDYKNGLMCCAHPDEKGAHDDYCDAAMLANWGASSPSGLNQIEFQDKNIFYR